MERAELFILLADTHHFIVDLTDSLKSSAPWSTRWPTALISLRLLMTPYSLLVRVESTKESASVWSGIGCSISYFLPFTE